jgi:basic amino acid/polyamine antiporter, APA family
MPIGITGSLIISTLIYVCVSSAVVGMASFRFLGETVPIINALMVNACCSHQEQVDTVLVESCLSECQVLRIPLLASVAHIVSGGCIWGLSASCFTSLMGQPRIFLRMAQDGLWFTIFAEIDPVTQVPSAGIKLSGLGCAILACFVPLAALANLISLGTLMVFTIVDAGVILLRLRTVSEATLHSIQNLHEKEHEKRRIAGLNDSALHLLTAFFLMLLGASLLLRNSDSFLWLVTLLMLGACGCGFSIGALTPTWVVSDREPQAHGHSTAFSCPMVPFLPLLGLGCNTFMMGSLPPSAWFSCFLWFALGVAVYFSYGIVHSTLGKKSRYADADAEPLLGMSIDGRDGYSSLLNIGVREVDE